MPPEMGLRHAKIVCTLGPATDDVKAMGALIDAGMDVARLNFSHGTHEEHARRIAIVRAEAGARGKPLAVLQDLQGPKIRTGGGLPAAITDGQTVTLVEGATGAPGTIAIAYARLARDLRAGDLVRRPAIDPTAS
jgi:pyruvate kinase